MTEEHGRNNRDVGQCVAVTRCQQMGEGGKTIDKMAPWCAFKWLHVSVFWCLKMNNQASDVWIAKNA